MKYYGKAESVAKEILKAFERSGITVSVFRSGKKLGYQIRAATQMKIPVMAILGEKEAAADTLTLRFGDGSGVKALPVGEVKNRILKLIQSRTSERLDEAIWKHREKEVVL